MKEAEMANRARRFLCPRVALVTWRWTGASDELQADTSSEEVDCSRERPRVLSVKRVK